MCTSFSWALEESEFDARRSPAQSPRESNSNAEFHLGTEVVAIYDRKVVLTWTIQSFCDDSCKEW